MQRHFKLVHDLVVLVAEAGSDCALNPGQHRFDGFLALTVLTYPLRFLLQRDGGAELRRTVDRVGEVGRHPLAVQKVHRVCSELRSNMGKSLWRDRRRHRECIASHFLQPGSQDFRRRRLQQGQPRTAQPALVIRVREVFIPRADRLAHMSF